jgi:phosphoserine phosphatase
VAATQPSPLPPVERDLPPPYRTVVFDCDSTLCSIEGIDHLAGPLLEELRPLTERAMSGALPLEEVFGLRLERVRPTRAALLELGREYVATLLPGARELVAALQEAEVEVRVVSGGLHLAVAQLGPPLGVPDECIHAVGLSFDGRGEYADFERSSPLTRRGGKPALLRTLQLARPVALVGDGATDLEAATEVDRFVAFGGVVARPAVHAAAKVRSVASDLRALAPLLLSAEQRQQLAARPAFRWLAAGTF